MNQIRPIEVATSAPKGLCAEGLEIFLSRFCPDPTTIHAALDRVGMANRMVWLTDGKILCRKGDSADCYWIICEGEIRVEEDDVLVVTRHQGELIGEGAFFRITTTKPSRGATLRAAGDTKLLRIDRALINVMKPADQVVWHETIARVVTAKLDQATGHRVGLHHGRSIAHELVARFVCSEGHSAALAALEPKGALRAIAPERSQAVIWFSDIAGFSKFAASLPPQEAGEVVRQIMDVQADEIAAAGGHIDKFMGDGLIAFWRAPDEPRLSAACDAAATAAHKATSRLLTFFKDRRLPLDIRVGLHAGPVILGDFGGSDRIAFTVIGDTVNAAARYEQAAKRADGSALGRVRVSPAIFSRVTDASTRAIFEQTSTSFVDKHGTVFEAFVTTY